MRYNKEIQRSFDWKMRGFDNFAFPITIAGSSANRLKQ